MEDILESFIAEEYPQLLESFLDDTLRSWMLDDASASFISSVAEGMDRLARLQDTLPEVSCLCVSFLYTDACRDQSRVRFDFFQDNCFAEDAVYSESVDASWWLARWKTHRSALEEAAKDRGAWIRPMHLDALLLRSFQTLGALFATQAKYWIAPLRSTAALRRLRKQETFYVLVGGYLDWQRPIFALLPEIDIFQCEARESLRFRTFEQCRYRQKKFLAVDLGASQFVDCRFEDCVFEKVDLSDTVFESCQFENTVFSDGCLAGALFSNTQLQAVRFERMCAEMNHSFDDRQDCYRQMEYSGCSIENVRLSDCRFPGALLTNCVTQGLEIDGGDFEKSDFSAFPYSPNTEGEDA